MQCITKLVNSTFEIKHIGISVIEYMLYFPHVDIMIECKYVCVVGYRHFDCNDTPQRFFTHSHYESQIIRIKPRRHYVFVCIVCVCVF